MSIEIKQDHKIRLGNLVRNLIDGRVRGTVEHFELILNPETIRIKGESYAQVNSVVIKLNDGTRGRVYLDNNGTRVDITQE